MLIDEFNQGGSPPFRVESGEWRFILLLMLRLRLGFAMKVECPRLEWRVESGEWRFILLIMILKAFGLLSSFD